MGILEFIFSVVASLASPVIAVVLVLVLRRPIGDHQQRTRCGLSGCLRPEGLLYSEKCSRVFQHIFESYQGAGKSIYEEAA